MKGDTGGSDNRNQNPAREPQDKRFTCGWNELPIPGNTDKKQTKIDPQMSHGMHTPQSNVAKSTFSQSIKTEGHQQSAPPMCKVQAWSTFSKPTQHTVSDTTLNSNPMCAACRLGSCIRYKVTHWLQIGLPPTVNWPEENR